MSVGCREDWIRAIEKVAEKLQVLDDFDGQFSDDVARFKLKKKVVSAEADVAAAVGLLRTRGSCVYQKPKKNLKNKNLR